MEERTVYFNIVTCYGMDVRGIVDRFPVEARDLSLLVTFDAKSAGVFFVGVTAVRT